ncbi:MAG: hypothetical protein VKS61_01745 [Candidatus Sericytochromatia bacterium]|nr:hypothetical protein [Candidatus Sericytochromatia bacterium]
MTANQGPQNPLDQLATFLTGRARDIGVTEQQLFHLLGIKGAVGPFEALLSGRPAAETLPDLASNILGGTDAVAKVARQHVEQAIPVVVMDELKPLLKKLSLLNEEGLKQLETYVNFLITQGHTKK